MREWVLVVEDQRADALVLESSIRAAADVDVRWATDICSARRMLEDRPSLVLLDMQLPDGDGMQILTWMQERGMHDVPVVVVTSDGAPKVRKACLAAGALQHIVKSLDLEQMERSVSHAVQRFLREIPAPAD